ncbi:hypothetical protein IJI17_02745 [Candidatus Saccharibacteria bacterium]|nr:hypothetical protein [Candidatus Saccharibacteria bacterium]
MAITPVPNTYPGFIFDGENSRNYGVYITDVSVFGTPEREVELLTIPGRNGDYALDKGRWANITVRYECALPTEDPADFVAGVAAFRNMLASRIGYKRLEDEINTTEYRMALFSAGIDVNTLNKEAGTFAVDFECKPQRFLKSGEEPVEGTNPLTITNPTLYPSKPMIEVDGYGTIDINGNEIEIVDIPLGYVPILTPNMNAQYKTVLPTDQYNTGDTIGVKGVSVSLLCELTDTTKTIVGFTNRLSILGSVLEGGKSAIITINFDADDLIFTAGTSTSVSFSESIYIQYVEFGSNVEQTGTVTVVGSVAYTNAYGDFQLVINTPSVSSSLLTRKAVQGRTYGEVYAVSTKGSLGQPLYIDLDIGEAYKYENATVISINGGVILPAELPMLVSGSNTITFDNTFTSVEVVPRWWQL